MPVPNVGPGILFGGAAADGGGWIFVGGKIIRIPPRSPLVRLLEEVAIHESVSTVVSTKVREAARRESLSSIVKIAERQLRAIHKFSQPAPHVKKGASGGKTGG
jgi:hypothetical protein